MKQKLTFISRHYPPNPNINGESIWDMVKYIENNRQIESNIICIDRTSGGGGQDREPVGNVIKIKTPYQGKNAILRFFTLLYDGYVLTRKARKYKNTIIITTTSPPLLPFWTSLLFRKRNIKWGLWTFDLFPEAFAVTGKIKEQNFFYRWVSKITYKHAPDFLITLGPQQAKHLERLYKKDIPSIILPCGVFFYQDKSPEIPEWWSDDKIFLGYCGNIGDAHNPDFIKATIDAIDPEKHRLILALYGNKAPDLKEYAKGKPGVILVDRVPRNQLHYIDIHLVSLIKSWTHIAVPSKAVSAIASNSCILFCGSQDSDNWYMFQEAGWFVDENDQLDEQLKNFIRDLKREDVLRRKEVTPQLYDQLKKYVLEAYKDVAELSEHHKTSNFSI